MDSADNLPDVTGLVVGFLGGTGAQGRGLAHRFASAGQRVLIGSRTTARAVDVAAELRARLPAGAAVSGESNLEVALAADVVVVAVPWDGHAALLSGLDWALAGKIVVDCVNPLGFDRHGAYALPVDEGSAAEQAARLLPGSTVVGAFHHVSAALLADEAVAEIGMDVLVVGDEPDAVDVVRALVRRLPGMRGIPAGRLRTARHLEGLTANLIAVNKRYKSHAGIRLTDV